MQGGTHLRSGLVTLLARLLVPLFPVPYVLEEVFGVTFWHSYDHWSNVNVHEVVLLLLLRSELVTCLGSSTFPRYLSLSLIDAFHAV